MFKKATISLAFFTLFLYLGLILSLFYYFDKESFFEILLSKYTISAITISLSAATIATFLALLIAVPGAYALSRYNFFGKRAIDSILEFPIIVSPAALGAAILIFFNNPLGEWIERHFIYFVFAFSGVVLAQFITILGIAVRFMKSAFDEVSIEYEKVAKTLGASNLKVFFTVTLPMAKRALLASGVLTWAKAMGEFGATITVAGTMAMKTETLPVAIYMKLSVADIKSSVVLVVILVFIGLGSLFGVKYLLRDRDVRA